MRPRIEKGIILLQRPPDGRVAIDFSLDFRFRKMRLSAFQILCPTAIPLNLVHVTLSSKLTKNGRFLAFAVIRKFSEKFYAFKRFISL